MCRRLIDGCEQKEGHEYYGIMTAADNGVIVEMSNAYLIDFKPLYENDNILFEANFQCQRKKN